MEFMKQRPTRSLQQTDNSWETAQRLLQWAVAKSNRTLGPLRVNEVTTNGTNCNNPTYLMNKENVIIEDTEERAHEFNKDFVNVGPPPAQERSFQTATIIKEFTSNSYNSAVLGEFVRLIDEVELI